jgi:hypothetical protein
MTKSFYFVDDPFDYRVHKFKSKSDLIKSLEGPDFDSDPYDEVRVYEAKEVKPEISRDD